MSLQELFESEQKVGSVISKKSLSDITSSYLIQSPGVLSASYTKYDQLLPHIDFSRPENFVKYGSAEKYYSTSIARTVYTFPYDGSAKEKLNWRNSSSYLDNYLFDEEYPKHTGSITIGTNFGTASVSSTGYYITPTRIEYIKIGTGLYKNAIYDPSKDRKHAFSIDSEKGFCLEFWLKQDPWSVDIATASCQILMEFAANKTYTTASTVDNEWAFVLITSGSLLSFNNNGDGQYPNTFLNAFNFEEWNHFAINVFSGGALNLWKNGRKLESDFNSGLYWPSIPMEFPLSGTIGAGNDFSYFGFPIGSFKFSGSLDDIRFWRRTRTDKEIASNWFHSVDGGYESDSDLDPDMAFYYKFNEYSTGTGSIDNIVLDYSGRKIMDNG